MSPENLPLEEPQPQGMTPIQRLTGVFFEPKKTFADIAGRPTWLLPVALIMIVSLVFVILIGQHIGWDRVARQSMEQQMASMSQQQRDAAEKSMDLSIKLTSVIAYIAPLFALVGYVIIAGALMGIASGIMAAGIRFKQMLAIVSWASLPTLVSSALAMVVMFLKKPEEFNVQNPIGFNPGAYMDPNTTGKFAHSLATSLDLFVLWVILLIGIGIKEAAGKKLSFAASLAAVVVPWAVIVLGKAAIAGAF